MGQVLILEELVRWGFRPGGGALLNQELSGQELTWRGDASFM